MATITISIDDEIEKKFRSEVKEHIGTGKGTLGKAITEAIKLWVEQKVQEDVATSLKQKLQQGYAMGKLLYKERAEIYDRK